MKVLLAVLLISPAFAQPLDPASLTKPLGESWPTYSGDYSGRRYSSLKQIDQSNVKNLTLAWTSRVTGGAGAPGGGGGGRGLAALVGPPPSSAVKARTPARPRVAASATVPTFEPLSSK